MTKVRAISPAIIKTHADGSGISDETKFTVQEKSPKWRNRTGRRSVET